MSRTIDLSAAVEHALRAPSVHNTQPWQWRVGSDRVELHADWNRHLAWTDPDRRDLVLSCGAALHHLRVALAAQHAVVHIDRLPDVDNEGHLATVTIQPATAEPDLVDTDAAALFPAIFRRRTDRRRMSHRAVPQTLAAQLVEVARREDTLAIVVAKDDQRRRLTLALRHAANEQAVAPGYAAELQIWTRRYAGSRDGVAAQSVAAAPPGLVDESPLRRFPRAALPQPRHPAGIGQSDDAAELLVLATARDDRLAWLRAGEALSAMLLDATRRGLATTPLSQCVEVATARDEVRQQVLRFAQYPQLIVRVGWPAPGSGELPETPRRDLRSVVTDLRPDNRR